MLRFAQCPPAALGENRLGQVEPPHHAVAQKPVDFSPRDKVQKTRFARPPGFLALAQDRNQLADDILGAVMIGRPFGNAFGQHFLQRLAEGIRRQQVGDRPGEHHDMLGAFLDLAEPFEERHGGRDIFDTDTQKCGHRDVQQLG